MTPTNPVRFRPAGLTVLRGKGRLAIVPLDDTHQDAAIKVRNHRLATTTQRVVTVTRAIMLFKMERAPQSPHTLTSADRHHVALLMRTGMIVEDGQRNLVVSDDILHSIYPEGFERIKAPTNKSDAARARVARQLAKNASDEETEPPGSDKNDRDAKRDTRGCPFS